MKISKKKRILFEFICKENQFRQFFFTAKGNFISGLMETPSKSGMNDEIFVQRKLVKKSFVKLFLFHGYLLL